MEEGDNLSIKDNLNIEVLSPDTKTIADNPKKKKKDQLDANEMSLTFRLNYNDHSVLFTGDIGKKTISRLLSDSYIKEKLDVDILKVPHHGSKNSLNEDFYELVSPDYALISYGKNNTYGHPHKVVVDALKKCGTEVLKTAETGQIDVYFTENATKIKTFK